jgi:GTPase
MSLFNKLLQDDKTCLIEENDDGYIEYKWRLDFKNNLNLKKLVSQLLWRLNEGKENLGIYEAHYVLGVYDDGTFGNLTKEELETTVDIFKNVVAKASAEIFFSETFNFSASNIYYCIVKLKPYDKKIEEINVLVCGAGQVGKTTLISHLCYSNKDNGNGNIRDYIMSHEHEKQSGNTSSVKKEIIGVKNNKLINYDYTHNWEEITKISDKIINIYDTPGSLKYFKSVLKALRTYMIDYIFILFEDSLDIYDEFIISYAKLLNIKYYKIKTKQDIYEIIDKNDKNDINDDILNISCVTPDISQIDDIKNILINSKKCEYNKSQNIYYDNIFKVSSIYNIPDRNQIIAGIQMSGSISSDSILYVIFPDLTHCKIKISSIFKKNIEAKYLFYKETGSIGYTLIDDKKKEITKECIITDNSTLNLIQKKSNKVLQLQILLGNIDTLESLKRNSISKLNLINSNIMYNVNIKSFDTTVESSYVNIEFDSNVMILDNLCILFPNDLKSSNNIIVAKII